MSVFKGTHYAKSNSNKLGEHFTVNSYIIHVLLRYYHFYMQACNHLTFKAGPVYRPDIIGINFGITQ